MSEDNVKKGNVFGDLIVVSIFKKPRKDKNKKSGFVNTRFAICECKVCGAIGEVRLSSLTSGNTKSCKLFHNKVVHHNGVTKIFFHDGDFGVINTEDYFLIKDRPVVHEKENHGYVRIMEDGKKILLHKLILREHGIFSKYIDHKNRIPEDNRKSNLRAVTQSQNLMNASLRSDKKTSKYKGVYKPSLEKKWTAKIRFDEKSIHIGRYENEKDAAKAYDIDAEKYYGEFACTNKMLGLL